MSPALDARSFVRALDLFRQALEIHRDHLNSLNVYPVPDGDTGTNMLLTQRAVTSALETAHGEGQFDNVGPAVSRASLMGARGNSGVILSQVLRGLCEAFPATGVVGGKQVAAALEHAAHEAYRAVTKPADGTMLSVLRDAQAAARSTARSNEDTAVVLTASLVAARESLNRTRDIQPDLRRAGVVDAGGKGIVLLLDALRSAVTGEPMTEPLEPLGPVGTQEQASGPRASNLQYEVQYLLEGRDDRVRPLRAELSSLGESVVVVGGGGLFNVHLHTDEPDTAIRTGEQAGVIRNVSITSLADQVEACIAGQAKAVRVAEQTSMVAVADGDGLVRALESLGAVVVHAGSQFNPSVAELIAAIDTAPADAVLVLPSHPDAVPVSEQAAAESSKRAVVVPAPSITAALSAAASFNPVADAEENLRSMKEVLAVSRSGELSRTEAHGDAPTGRAKKGDWVGVADEHVVYAGASAEDATLAVTTHLVHPGAELLTLIVGTAATPEDERAVRRTIGRAHSDLRVEVLAGGPRRCAFLIGVE